METKHPAKPDAVRAIESVAQMLSRLAEVQKEIANAVKLAQSQWEALVRIGGDRADHAAALLANVRTPLCDLATLASRCERRIADMQRDPFEIDPKPGGDSAC